MTRSPKESKCIKAHLLKLELQPFWFACCVKSSNLTDDIHDRTFYFLSQTRWIYLTANAYFTIVIRGVDEALQNCLNIETLSDLWLKPVKVLRRTPKGSIPDGIQQADSIKPDIDLQHGDDFAVPDCT